MTIGAFALKRGIKMIKKLFSFKKKVVNFPFYDAPNTATIVCCHVLDKEKPILYASHDEEDGIWQFLCGEPHDNDEARLIALEEAFEIDNSIGELKDMYYGYCATRESRESSWIIEKK